jgi:O-antigen/teichoic acid export membrane protein
MINNHNFKNIFKSEFVKNFSVMFGGNMTGQLISMLIYPVLTRLYTHEDFGIFSLFLSISGLLTIFATGRYEEALVITKDKKETSLLLSFSLKLLMVISCFYFFLFFFIRNTLFRFFNVQEISEFWYIIPITVFITGLYYFLTNLAVRHKDFKNYASSNLTYNGISSAFKFLFGKLSLNAIGLIFSNLIGQSIACASFYKYRKFILKSLLNNHYISEKHTGVSYKEFPIYNMSRTLVSYLSSNSPFLLLIGTFGEAKLGLFSLAVTLLFRPVATISGSLYSVFYEKSIRLKNENKVIMPIFKQFWQKSFFFSVPILISAYIISPSLFGFIFGTSWIDSAIYFRYLLPWVLFEFMTTSVAFLPIVFKKQAKAFWLESTGLILRLSALSVGIILKDFNISVLLLSIVTSGYFAGKLIWYISLIKKYETRIN